MGGSPQTEGSGGKVGLGDRSESTLPGGSISRVWGRAQTGGWRPPGTGVWGVAPKLGSNWGLAPPTPREGRKHEKNAVFSSPRGWTGKNAVFGGNPVFSCFSLFSTPRGRGEGENYALRGPS